MSDSKKRSGLGFLDVLTIVFVVLKLLGVINWSWWWCSHLSGFPLSLCWSCTASLPFATADRKRDGTCLHTSRRSAPNALGDKESDETQPFADEDERNIIEQFANKLHGIPPFSNRSVGSPLIKPRLQFPLQG